MNKLVLLTCLCFPLFSHAQFAGNTYSMQSISNGSDQLRVNNSLSMTVNSDVPGSRKKRKGAVLMIVGGVLFINGVVLFASSDKHVSIYLNESNGNGTYGSADQKAEAGVLLMAAGLGLAIPGIIIYSKGNKLYQASRTESTVSLHLQGNGLALRWKL